MPKIIEITIDGKKIKAKDGQTILEVAKENGIKIPELCNHPDLTVKANCRICCVEIDGSKGLQTACSTRVKEGMIVKTNSEKVKQARKINLELIFSQHNEECFDCVWRFNCNLLKLADEFDAKITRFEDRKKHYPTYKFGNAIIFDSSKCIDCRNCVEMCAMQQANFLEVEKRGNFLDVIPTRDKKKDCIYCGQCLVHCPAGAFEGVGEFEEVELPLKDKTKTVVFQFAPSIRASIGEEFGMPAGSIVTGQLVAAIKKLGADFVFDVSVGADFTTVEEGKELISRIQNKKNLPMFTSCCPAWVKYVEFYRPDLIPNLTSARSPQMMMGGIIKTFWAEKCKINPKDIVVVSIMPCTAKKQEFLKPEMEINGMKPIDYVFTTRELAYLLQKKKIELPSLKPEEADNPLGDPSGAGVIYGTTGGVVESAIRTVYKQLTDKELPKLEFKDARGLEGIKKAEIKINGATIKIGITNGMGNAVKLLEELKKNPKAFDYIEVMACPGGCIGGGGQPMPTSQEIRRKRAEALYSIDKGKKIRAAHDNPVICEFKKEVSEEGAHKILHTTYKKDKGKGYETI